MRTSRPKSSVSHDRLPLKVAPRVSVFETKFCASRTVPIIFFTVWGYTVLDLGAYMKSVHGPMGAEARTSGRKKHRKHDSEHKTSGRDENMIDSNGRCVDQSGW